MNSRAKGARVEREAAKFLASIGFPAERNARNGKSADDIVVPSLPNVHFEVKGDRSIGVGTKALHDAMEQAVGNSGKRIAVVLWKEHLKGWRLTCDCHEGVLYTIGQKHIAQWLTFQITRDGAGKE